MFFLSALGAFTLITIFSDRKPEYVELFAVLALILDLVSLMVLSEWFLR